MPENNLLKNASPAYRLMFATSWLAPDSWRQSQEDAIWKAIESRPSWTEYVSLVDRHRTHALSWAALSRVSGLAIPEQVKHKLKIRSDACRMQAVRQGLLLAQLLKSFNSESIPVMPVKGQILSQQLYGDVGLRHSKDIDLEVLKEDLDKAIKCLESIGWQLEPTFSSLTPRQWQSILRFEPCMNLVHLQTGFQLELHWRNHWETPDLTAARWSRSDCSIWQGATFQAMSPGDLTLYLSCHGGVHAWFRAKWLGDMARAQCIGLLNWENALREGLPSGHERALMAGIYLLQELYGLPMPALTNVTSKCLRSRLITIPLQFLLDPEEPTLNSSLASFRKTLRMSRYESILQPRKKWRDSLAGLLYFREDYSTLPLPDSLFWVYKPLRPALWGWRCITKSGKKPKSIII
jgi:hypothetical protein